MKTKIFTVILLEILFCSCMRINDNSSALNVGLIAYYPFNGNANDASGNGNNGVIHGAQFVNDRNGQINSACYFDGNFSYIDIGNSAKIKRYQNDYSVTGWIKLNNFSSTYNSIIMSNRNWLTPSISGSMIGVGGLLGYLPRKIEFINNAIPTNDIYSFDYLGSDTQINLDNWYYFTISYKYNGDSSNIVKIYVNGSLESQKVMGETIDPLEVNTFLGCESILTPKDYSLNGYLDEVRIYSRVLTDSEIVELYLKY
jgi:hypothetical protein